MENKMQKVLILFIFLTLSACANPYSQYYQSQVYVGDYENLLVPYAGEPEISMGRTPEEDASWMQENGYLMIGSSSFNAGGVSQESVITHAKNIGAERVVLYQDFSHRVSGSIPLTLPDTQTAYHSGTVSSNGISGTYYGTSTTYGTTTTYIPYTVNRYDYGATYWSKIKRGGLGVFLEELTSEQKRVIGSNKGAAIITIVKNSAAYEADIIPGDVLKKVGNVDVYDVLSAVAALRKHLNKKVVIKILREGTELTKEVFFPPFD